MATERKFTPQFQRIQNLCSDPKNGLNSKVRHMATRTLLLFSNKKVLPHLINTIEEDQCLILEWFGESKEEHYSIDFYATGEVIVLISEPGKTKKVIEYSFEQYYSIIQKNL